MQMQGQNQGSGQAQNKAKKQKSLFVQALDLITYKKSKKPKTFVLAEMKEGQDSDKNKDPNSSIEKSQNPSQKQNKRTEQSPQQELQSNQPKQQKKGASEENQNAAPTVNRGSPNLRGTGPSRRKINQKPRSSAQVRAGRNTDQDQDQDQVKSDLLSNRVALEQAFGLPANKDLVLRDFTLGGKKGGFIAYLDGMADKQIINNYILRPLFLDKGFHQQETSRGQARPLEDIVQTNDTKRLPSFKKVFAEILKGNTALYVDGLDYMLACESIGYEKRGVESPKTETVVKGPQEAFGENLRTNISLLRRIIRNSNLTTEFFEVGEKSSTTIGLIYLKDLANPAIVQEVRRRLTNVKTDFLVSAGMLEQLIEDNPFSLLPTILSTERPDRTASHLLEGRLSILMDGTPFAMVVPVTITEILHSPEDAALKWQAATAVRGLRYFALLAALMLPAFYIAFTNFHREMIPTDLLIAIVKAKENVPFPTLVEILLMELGFELIREAGVRIPGVVGSTLGIIGALILGQAAVSANIVSPVLIIIVAVTGLSNFSIPNYSLAFGVRIMRFYFIAAAALFGFYGIAMTFLGFTLVLVHAKSFGVPFLAGIAPKTKKSKDIVLRLPLWLQENRPDYLNPLDRPRQPEIARLWAQQDPGQRKSGRRSNTEE